MLPSRKLRVLSASPSHRGRFKGLTRIQWFSLACALGALFAFACSIHPLLSVTARADADILVVEGWVADEILAAAAEEFHQGHYTLLLTSGLEFASENDGRSVGSYASRAAAKMITFGIDRSVILPCPTPLVSWNRTSSSARAVRDMLRSRGVHPKGINVITAGPHARETWAAYRHIMERETRIGIISVPNQTYDPSTWWASQEGRRWVFKNIVGWTKEVLIGQRS